MPHHLHNLNLKLHLPPLLFILNKLQIHTLDRNQLLRQLMLCHLHLAKSALPENLSDFVVMRAGVGRVACLIEGFSDFFDDYLDVLAAGSQTFHAFFIARRILVFFYISLVHEFLDDVFVARAEFGVVLFVFQADLGGYLELGAVQILIIAGSFLGRLLFGRKHRFPDLLPQMIFRLHRA